MEENNEDSRLITKRDLALGLGVKAVEYVVGGVLGNSAFEAMKSAVVKRGEHEKRGMLLGRTVSVPVYINSCWYSISAKLYIRPVGFVISLSDAHVLSAEEAMNVAEDGKTALKLASEINELGLPIFFAISNTLVQDRDDGIGSAGGEVV